ncbi:muts domain V-domain-containing protein [Clohesyomyces aquaticus]|uniref:Muts domain V-domain-containing protein n=1 Tax=Clohesyomyces aquaticus TaxID=1231657 RepID=A0A1Y2AAA8_9PLEO|nr:muts domain V-domain-containing protein [Clohesyomyces aquaticus]
MIPRHSIGRAGFRSLNAQALRRLERPHRLCSTALAFPFLNATRPTRASRVEHVLPSSSPAVMQIRGAKRKFTVDLDDILQGAIDTGHALPPQDDEEPEYPPLIQQVRNNMLKFNHCVLLTRVGGFYELYFEHADEYAPLLNLKKAKRKASRGSNKPAIPMAGFPAYQLDRYLKILVQDLNKHVAISDEFLNDAPRKAKGELAYTRRVSRIVTPGTLIDEHFMDPWQNNYLLSIHIDPEVLRKANALDESPGSQTVASVLNLPRTEVGLAWIDLSSGDFLTQSTDIASLPSAVARINPREIVLDSIFEEQEHSRIVSILQEDGHIITFQRPSERHLSVADWIPMLEDVVDDFDESHFKPSEVAAGGSLLHYVKHQLLGSTTRLQAPVRHQMEDHMNIDKNTLRALEIRSTIRDGTYEGSLLHSLKKTVTKSGTRLLTQRLSAPSMSLSTINDRLDLVEEMLEYYQLRREVTTLLGRTFDTLRLVTKFTVGRGDADDLVELSKTILTTSDILQVLRDHSTSRKAVPIDLDRAATEERRRNCLPAIERRFELTQPLELAKRIYEAIDEEGLSERHRIEDDEAAEMVDYAQEVLGREAGEEDLKPMPKRIQPKLRMIEPSFKSATDGRDDVWIMQRSASKTLERLHEQLEKLSESKGVLEEGLRAKTGAETLTLKWTPNLAHIAHVKGKDATRVTKHYPKSISSSKSTRSFQVPEWTQLGAQLDETRFRIRNEEQRVLGELREEVVRNLVKLRRNAAVLDELDVACAFAVLAREKSFVRPILNAGTSHNIVGGRHPVVEAGLAEQGRIFSPNDCSLGEDERIWLITGPNMAGKSTYLRQNALISILAQTGSFVPAEYAEIGLVDKIFSRVGSADNLYRDQSTFMVEMLETAQILKEATPRSFVIMDEVGRGTTPEDGIAVGYACLHHLYHVNQCRSLFATHFHALADMTEDFEKLGCYCNNVVEESDGKFSYAHKLCKGVNRQSHALKVARVAGLPEEAIAVAAQAFEQLKPQEDNPTPIENENEWPTMDPSPRKAPGKKKSKLPPSDQPIYILEKTHKKGLTQRIATFYSPRRLAAFLDMSLRKCISIRNSGTTYNHIYLFRQAPPGEKYFPEGSETKPPLVYKLPERGNLNQKEREVQPPPLFAKRVSGKKRLIAEIEKKEAERAGAENNS